MAYNCRTIQGTQKFKQYELQHMCIEFKQYRLYEILTHNTKQMKIFSRTLEMRVQRPLLFPISRIQFKSNKCVVGVRGKLIRSSTRTCNNFYTVSKCKTAKSRCLLQSALFTFSFILGHTLVFLAPKNPYEIQQMRFWCLWIAYLISRRNM